MMNVPFSARIAAAVFVLSVSSASLRAQEPATSSATAPAPASTSRSSILREVNDGFVSIYETVAPTVVVIKVTKRLAVGDPESMLERFGFDFFSRDPDDSPDTPRQPKTFRLPQRSPESEGSGIIVDSQGHIFTNFHVIEGSDEIAVQLKDGREFPAKVIGADAKTDIAVIKIDPPADLPVARLGDSDAVKVGQLACAIGTPYNLDYSFTVGVVSAVGRGNLFAADYEDYIQTDASINPGNSGGPLVDIEGRIIGMNTLINGINRGLGFAIPINMAKDVGFKLIKSGRVVRPWLGIRIDTLREQPPAIRDYFKGVDSGVVVNTIEPDAPAYDSDLRPADVITAVDGVPVQTARDLQKQVLNKEIGATLELTVWRNGKVLRIKARTGEFPAEDDVAAGRVPKQPEPESSVDDSLYGLTLQNLTPALIERLELKSESGVLVTDVAPDSPADLAGIEPKDVITEADSRTVGNVADFKAIAGKANAARGILVFVDRDGEKTYAVIKSED